MTPITLQATVQDDRLGFVIGAALLGLIAGLYVRLFADKKTSDHVTRLRDVSRPRYAVRIAAGVVVAFYSIRTIYLDDPTFDAEAGELWRITAEVFAGTLAAKTLSDLTGTQKEPPAPAEKKPAAKKVSAGSTRSPRR